MEIEPLSLEPRRRIHPVLRAIVGLIGVAALIACVGLLGALILETGPRDYTLLVGVAGLGVIAWGCGFIAAGRLDRMEDAPLRPRTLRMRILWTVLYTLGAASFAVELYARPITAGSIISAVFVGLILAGVYYDTWRTKATSGR